MRRSVRKLVPSFALLLLTACSLVVDFPAPLDRGERDAAIDGGRRDGEADDRDGGSERDASDGDSSPDAGACELETHAGCEPDELCCDRKAGEGPICVSTSGDECEVCGEACIEPGAPNCGERSCECTAGSGEGCSGSQVCMGAGADARCVQCLTDQECEAREQCVENRCVECSRGDDLASAADDEGCSGSTPICNEDNRCVACSDSPDNCPNDQQCVGGVGCVGCDPSAAITENGCTRTTPICKPVSGMLQCVACEANTDCRGGFCDRESGACTNVCDPQAELAANNCPSGKPVCKLVEDDFTCAACTPADCAEGLICATAGPQAGNCVQCYDNSDCPAAAPSCNRTSGMCTGCGETPSTPIFDNASGQCVECVEDAHCADDAGGLYCHPTRKECVTCSALPMPDMACAARDADTPRCGPTGVCTGCMDDAQCAAATPASPFCVSGTCSPCTAVTMTSAADLRCAALSATTPTCLTSGTRAGRCVACDPTGDRGCPASASQCDPVNLACVACITSATAAVDDGCTAATPDCVSFPSGGPRCVECDPTQPSPPERCDGRACISTATSATCAPGGPGPGSGPGPRGP